MRINSAGRVLIGTNEVDVGFTDSGSGVAIWEDGLFQAARSSPYAVGMFNKLDNDGQIIQFYKDGGLVGNIGTILGGIYIGDGDTGLEIDGANDAIYPFNTTTKVATDGHTDLGDSDKRFKDLYLSGGVYLGGTGSANKLDDYEQGTHEATITCSTSGTITLGAQDYLAYTKVGRLVTITGGLVVSAISSPTGYFTVSLPFGIGSNDAGLSQRMSGTVTMQNVSGVNVNQFVILGIQGTSEVRVYLGDGTLRQEDSAQAIIYNSDMYFNFHYFTS